MEICGRALLEALQKKGQATDEEAGRVTQTFVELAQLTKELLKDHLKPKNFERLV